MNVIYPAGSGNVGDELNSILWSTLLSDSTDRSVALLGIGTLLNEAFCARLEQYRRVVVFGTGAGYGALPKIDKRWDIYAVRGFRTALKLGLPQHRAVADSAYFLGALNWRYEKHKGRKVVVPHHRSLRLIDWAHVCDEAGLEFVSPLLPVSEFMEVIGSADLVITEAMHGAIFADIARVPWCAFTFGRQFHQEKWLDWSEMFDLDVRFVPMEGYYDPGFYLPGRPAWTHYSNLLKSSLASRGMGKEKWLRITPPGRPCSLAQQKAIKMLRFMAGTAGQLSSDTVLASRVDALYSRLDEFRAAYGLTVGQCLSGDARAYFSGDTSS